MATRKKYLFLIRIIILRRMLDFLIASYIIQQRPDRRSGRARHKAWMPHQGGCVTMRRTKKEAIRKTSSVATDKENFPVELLGSRHANLDSASLHLGRGLAPFTDAGRNSAL